MSVRTILKRFFINSTSLRWLLGLLFMVSALHSDAIIKGHKKHSKGVEKTMRVVAIQPASSNEPFLTVIFSESQRFYKLPNDANPKYLELLKASAHDHTLVTIKRASEESDVIISVKKAKTK